MKSNWITLAKATLGIGLLALLLRWVDLRELWTVLSSITPLWIFILFAIAFVLIWLSCIKWRLFLSARGAHISILNLMELYLIGYFFNNFAPGNVGGDVIRSYMLGRHISSQSNSFGTVFLERITGFMALIGMAILASWWRPDLLEDMALRVMLLLMAVGFLAMGLLLVSSRAQDVFRSCLQKLPAHGWLLKLNRFTAVVFYFRSHRDIWVKALWLSAMFHICTIINTLAACRALGLEADFLDLAVLVPVVLVIAAVPVSMNALGIMEGAFMLFLTLAGLTPEEALSVALLLRAKNVVLALLGGLLFLRWNGKLKQKAEITNVE